MTTARSSADVAERRAPIDRVVDLAVAAPAAAFAAALRAVPLAARAGTLGAAKAIERVSETVASMREGDGDVPTSTPSRVAGSHVRSGESPADPVLDEVVDGGPSDAGAGDDEATAPVGLPIEGYDDLAARQVVARLETLDPDDLHLVEAYERAHRNRSTVLGKVASLQA